MRKRRTAACFMAAAMVMGSLAGCGQKAAPETTAAQTSEAKKEETAAAEETKAEAESTGEQVELKVFGFKTGAEEGAIPELIEQFNKENPDIKVVYEGISNAGGYQDVLTARLASGQGDDVFFANPNYLPQLQEAGYTEDLSDMPVVEKYSGLVKDLLTINDSIPGLGMEVAVFGMFSNLDVLKEAGIDHAPANYKEFLEDCEILKKAGKTPVVAGAKDGTGVAILSLAKSMDPVYQASDKMDQIAKMNSGELKFGDVMQPGFALVEDLISTAGSCIEVVEALRDAGAEVLGIVSIFTYGLQKGLDRLAAAHITNVSLSNFDAVCEVAAEEGQIRPEDIERLRAFRSNPSDEGWIAVK